MDESVNSETFKLDGIISMKNEVRFLHRIDFRIILKSSKEKTNNAVNKTLKHEHSYKK